jgi:hypothetical protein
MRRGWTFGVAVSRVGHGVDVIDVAEDIGGVGGRLPALVYQLPVKLKHKRTLTGGLGVPSHQFSGMLVSKRLGSSPGLSRDKGRDEKSLIRQHRSYAEKSLLEGANRAKFGICRDDIRPSLGLGMTAS